MARHTRRRTQAIRAFEASTPELSALTTRVIQPRPAELRQLVPCPQRGLDVYQLKDALEKKAEGVADLLDSARGGVDIAASYGELAMAGLEDADAGEESNDGGPEVGVSLRGGGGSGLGNHSHP